MDIEASPTAVHEIPLGKVVPIRTKSCEWNEIPWDSDDSERTLGDVEDVLVHRPVRKPRNFHSTQITDLKISRIRVLCSHAKWKHVWCSRSLGGFMLPMSGLTLHDFLKYTTFDNEKKDVLLRSVGCLSSALAFLHNHKIWHGDINPQNILLKKTMSSTEVVLSNLSIPKKLYHKKMGKDSGIHQLQRYRAPEVVYKSQNGSASDVYSLGCVFFELYWVRGGYSLNLLSSIFTKQYYHEEEVLMGHILSVATWDEFGDMKWMKKMIQSDQNSRPRAYEVEAALVVSTRKMIPLQDLFCYDCIRNIPPLKNLLSAKHCLEPCHQDNPIIEGIPCAKLGDEPRSHCVTLLPLTYSALPQVSTIRTDSPAPYISQLRARLNARSEQAKASVRGIELAIERSEVGTGQMHHSTRIADLQGVLVQGLPESSHYKAVGVPKTSASSNKTTSGKQSSSSSELVPSSASGSIFQTSRQKRGRNANGEAIDGNDDSQDDNDEDRRRYTKGKRPCSRPQPRLKCPFYQRQPEKHGKRAACRGRGFMDMAKLKDHLKRVHSQPVRCPRCWQEMESDDAYVVHAQREEGCEKLPEPYDDRISRLKWSSLDFKTAPYSQLKSGGEKWRKLYNVLFPQDTEIPSPFEELRTSAQWEKFLPDVLYEELKNELGPLLEPVQSRIKERIPFIIQRCKAQMLSVPQTETNTSGSSSPISNSQEVVNQAITGAFHELDTYDSFTRHDVIPAEYISNLPPSSTTTEPNHYPQTNYGPDYRAPDFDFSWCLEDRHNRDLEESNSLG